MVLEAQGLLLSEHIWQGPKLRVQCLSLGAKFGSPVDEVAAGSRCPWPFFYGHLRHDSYQTCLLLNGMTC